MRKKAAYIRFIVVIATGLTAAFACQFLTQPPGSKHLHIRNFRYGKDPSVIRCNRGDTLLLTFSTDDTGHSFFLEEFNMDVKVSPGQDEVSVFQTTDPTETPLLTDTVELIARHEGLLNYISSKSSYRCHVWCGPMHAFEQGKLVIFPNTLLFFSLGSLLGLVLFWGWTIRQNAATSPVRGTARLDLLQRFPVLERLLVARWPQLLLMLVALLMIYVVVIIGLLGTSMSGRNLGVLLMWAVWLFVLVAILTPLLSRSWCSVCPLPVIGDWLQRGALFAPVRGKRDGYRNRYFGLFKDWPDKLDNNWLRLFFFLVLSTFSTTLVANPSASAYAVLLLIGLPTVMALIWKHRAFCRYLCPVSVFITPFSGMGPIAIASKDQEKCNQCKAHSCEKGSVRGWACPYGINIGSMEQLSDCGMCMECLRSCTFKNVTLVQKPFGQAESVRNYSEAWLSIAIFSFSIIYSIVYLGTWTDIRDYVNILDKQNWDFFGIYTVVVWTLVLGAAPGLLFLCSKIVSRSLKRRIPPKQIFFAYTSFLLPLGMMLWIAFVIPMLFVNITFIAQSASDPLGWGWDLFGTAGSPWHQFLPEYIPWFQAILVLLGMHLSLKNIEKKWAGLIKTERMKLSIPILIFLLVITSSMLFFFTN